MMKNNTLQLNLIKQYIRELLSENLTNFELIKNGKHRTVGDLVEGKVIEILLNAKSELITEKKLARSKKSIEDITLISDGIVYYVDPKTHDENSEFSMPNLTSINKIKKLFLSKNKELIYVFVNYKIINNIVMINNIEVLLIWELDKSILGVGALGNGQLQIKNANKTLVTTTQGKLKWYDDFKKLVQGYLVKQQNKINKQLLEWQ